MLTGNILKILVDYICHFLYNMYLETNFFQDLPI